MARRELGAASLALDGAFAVDQDVEAIVHLAFLDDLLARRVVGHGAGAQHFPDLGVRKLRLMTNNPRKIVGLEGHSLEIVEQVPIKQSPNPHNTRYLDTKREKMGHTI